MVATPGATPPMSPVEGLAVAIATGVLDQVPPPTELLSVIVAPVHTDVGPDMVLGEVKTTTDFVTSQPGPVE